MKIKELGCRDWYATILSHKEQIKDIVSYSLIDVCEYLYDLNVPICMTCSNYERGKRTFLTIDYDLLSKTNKQIVKELIIKYPNVFSIGRFSPLAEHNEVKIYMPIDENTEVEEIKKFFFKFAKLFEMQDVQSYIDEERFLKNVYTIPDILYRYLQCEKGDLSANEFEEIKEIEDFLMSLGFLKVKTSEFNDGKTGYNGVCEHLWLDNKIDRTWMADYQIYGAILKNREALFGGKAIKKENLNLNEILRVINRFANNFLGEQFFFYPDDKRFYLNEELLAKHNRFVKYQNSNNSNHIK